MPNPVLLHGLRGAFKLWLRVRPDSVRGDDSFPTSKATRVLLVCTTALGDTLLSTPAIRAVRRACPKASISVLASPPAREVLLFSPHIDELIPHPGRVDLRYLLRLPGLIRMLRRRQFDLAIVLHANDPDIVPLTYVSGAPYRAGWRESRLGFLFTHPVPTVNQGEHIVDIRLRNLQALGIGPQGRELEYFVQPEERARTASLLRNVGPEGSLLVGIHPFGSIQRRWWPPSYVETLAQQLREDYGAETILFGGPKEVQAAESISAKSNIVSVVGRLSIRESAALISRCALFISTDSGPMHLAQAVNVPTIALCGPAGPNLIGPVSFHSRSIHKGMDCTRCAFSPCPTPSCMEEIQVDDVMALIREMAAGRLIPSFADIIPAP
jgi:heptosyltransferase II